MEEVKRLKELKTRYKTKSLIKLVGEERKFLPRDAEELEYRITADLLEKKKKMDDI